MRHYRLALLFLQISIQLLKVNNCFINKNEMNCSKLSLTDCPILNINITVLILDGNLLTTLNTKNCNQWRHLNSLSVQDNNLQDLLNFDNFLLLEFLNLRNNSLTTFRISSPEIIQINLSYNQISYVFIDAHNLEVLDISHNELVDKSLRKLIKNLKKSTRIEKIDFSFNLLQSLPITLMTFAPQHLKSLNFSSNRFKQICLGYFSEIKSNNLHVDFSNNSINAFCRPSLLPNIKLLNLSYNNLSFLDVENLRFSLSIIDLSHNPLNCSCYSGRLFINYIQEKSELFASKSQINCQSPFKKNLFNVNCGSTSITSIPNYQTKIPWPTKLFKVSDGRISWKWILLCVVSIALIILIGTLALKCIKKNQYQCLSKFSGRTGLPFFRRIHRKPGRERLLYSDLPPEHTGSNESFEFHTSGIVMCSSIDTEWINEDIVRSMNFKIEVIDSKIKQFPRTADFILICVNGNKCLTDSIFVKNVKLALQKENSYKVRLLIRQVPNFEKLMIENCLTNYLRSMIFDNAYFTFDPANPEICIENLKLLSVDT